MKLLRCIEFLRRHLKTVIRLCLVVLVLLVLADAIPALVDQMPGSVKLSIRNDRSLSIREAIHDVKVTLLAERWDPRDAGLMW